MKAKRIILILLILASAALPGWGKTTEPSEGNPQLTALLLALQAAAAALQYPEIAIGDALGQTVTALQATITALQGTLQNLPTAPTPPPVAQAAHETPETTATCTTTTQTTLATRPQSVNLSKRKRPESSVEDHTQASKRQCTPDEATQPSTPAPKYTFRITKEKRPKALEMIRQIEEARRKSGKAHTSLSLVSIIKALLNNRDAVSSIKENSSQANSLAFQVFLRTGNASVDSFLQTINEIIQTTDDLPDFLAQLNETQRELVLSIMRGTVDLFNTISLLYPDRQSEILKARAQFLHTIRPTIKGLMRASQPERPAVAPAPESTPQAATPTTTHQVPSTRTAATRPGAHDYPLTFAGIVQYVLARRDYLEGELLRGEHWRLNQSSRYYYSFIMEFFETHTPNQVLAAMLNTKGFLNGFLDYYKRLDCSAKQTFVSVLKNFELCVEDQFRANPEKAKSARQAIHQLHTAMRKMQNEGLLDKAGKRLQDYVKQTAVRSPEPLPVNITPSANTMPLPVALTGRPELDVIQTQLLQRMASQAQEAEPLDAGTLRGPTQEDVQSVEGQSDFDEDAVEDDDDQDNPSDNWIIIDEDY